MQDKIPGSTPFQPTSYVPPSGKTSDDLFTQISNWHTLQAQIEALEQVVELLGSYQVEEASISHEKKYAAVSKELPPPQDATAASASQKMAALNSLLQLFEGGALGQTQLLQMSNQLLSKGVQGFPLSALGKLEPSMNALLTQVSGGQSLATATLLQYLQQLPPNERNPALLSLTSSAPFSAWQVAATNLLQNPQLLGLNQDAIAAMLGQLNSSEVQKQVATLLPLLQSECALSPMNAYLRETEEQTGVTSVRNVGAALVSSQVSGCLTLLQTLLQANPTNTSLKGQIQSLLQMQGQPLTSQNVKALETIALNAFETQKELFLNLQLPTPLNQQFIDQAIDLIEGQGKLLTAGVVANQQAAAQGAYQASLLTTGIEALSFISRVVNRMVIETPPTPQQIQGTLEALTQLAAAYPNLSEGGKAAVTQALTTLEGLKNTTTSLGQILGMAFVIQKGSTESQNTLTEAAKKLPLYPTIVGSIGEFATQAQLLVLPAFNFSPNQTQAASAAVNGAIAGLTLEKGIVTAQSTGQTRAAQVLGATQTTTNNARADLEGKKLLGSNESLPDQFARLILDWYMPGQEAYLAQLAQELQGANVGSSVFNSIFSAITGINNPDFNLSAPTTTPPSATWIAKAKQIQAALSKVVGQLKAAESAIKGDISKIQNNPNLSPTQKTSLISALQQLYNPATGTGSLASLTNHCQTLNGSYTTDAGGTWDPNTTANQNLVNNGDPGVSPPDSLGGFYGFIHHQVSSYTAQSTTQQMMLQMRMTEIQQEWTLVSTCLQILFQAYSDVESNFK